MPSGSRWAARYSTIDDSGKASLPATIEICQAIAPNDCILIADGSQIHQVLMTLCINAAHSIGEEGAFWRWTYITEMSKGRWQPSIQTHILAHILA